MTKFVSQNLSFNALSAPWQHTEYNEDISQEVIAYDHSIAALGGFWNAALTLRLFPNRLEDWIHSGIGRQITVKGRGNTTAWEGIVNRITYNIGGYDVSIGPFIEIANKVMLSYSIFIQLSEGSSTGVRVTTDYIEDTISQGKYGILAKNFSAGGISSGSVTELQGMLLNRYKNPARSENLSLPGEPNVAYTDLKIECIGYIQLLQRYIYNNDSYTVQNLSDKISAIIALEPNGVFTSSLITRNTSQVVAYENSNAEAWGLLKNLVLMGDTNLNRYTLGCYENRRIKYIPVLNDVLYIRPLREGIAAIQNSQGGMLDLWEVRPGVYIHISDLGAGQPLAASLEDDVRVLFAETVQYRHPDSLVINGAHIFRVEQRLAQLGISGIS